MLPNLSNWRIIAWAQALWFIRDEKAPLPACVSIFTTSILWVCIYILNACWLILLFVPSAVILYVQHWLSPDDSTLAGWAAELDVPVPKFLTHCLWPAIYDWHILPDHPAQEEQPHD